MANERHLLLTIQGTYSDSSQTAETWQTGVRLALVFGLVDDVGTLPNNWDPVATTIARTEADWTIAGNWDIALGTTAFHPDDYLNDQVAPAWATFLGSTPCSSNLKTETIKLSPIGSPAGHLVPAPPYTSGTPCTLTYTSGFPTGGSGANYLPLQNSIAVSTRSRQPGRHGRGRMFMPPITTTAVDAHGFLTSTWRDTVADAAEAWFGALALDPVGPTEVHVRPIITGKPYVNYGTIVQTKVDTVIDTQRRRRRSLVGSIATRNITY
jgi:hypothetical protein